jgi:hypothetical protein
MNLLDLEEEKFKTVTVKGYTFKIRCILPTDKMLITQRRTRMQNGQPVEMFLTDEFIFMDNVATVDVCTEDRPKEFDANKSSINWPDIDLINMLAMEIKSHSEDIQEKLKKNRPTS